KLMGREVLEVLPVPPIALHLRTGIAMVSYADSFVFGITADHDTAPDVDRLATGIEQGVARLVAISRTRTRKRARKGSAA
ncbi:MAG: diacylglycerol O-acyltransferase / wax synthase, partial [Mycobacterium sp.]|nr:diacylglycerol O-acyltransferase / wax synthase [Mycobacterium sp.]